MPQTDQQVFLDSTLLSQMGFTLPSDIRKLVNVSWQPDVNRALFLAEKQRVDYVYNAAALEDNPFTLPEVKTLLDGITVGGHKLIDEQQILNQNEGWSALLKMVRKESFDLSKAIYCKLNKLVAREEALKWGQFRDGLITIGGTDHRPPAPEKLDGVFATTIQLVQSAENPLIQGILFFLSGSLNQFFYDGNKRTARLMSNGILLRYGLPPLNIQAKDKLSFNQVMLDFYSSLDAIPALQYFYDTYIRQNSGLGFGF